VVEEILFVSSVSILVIEVDVIVVVVEDVVIEELGDVVVIIVVVDVVCFSLIHPPISTTPTTRSKSRVISFTPIIPAT
jgi:hypothetical protein